MMHKLGFCFFGLMPVLTASTKCAEPNMDKLWIESLLKKRENGKSVLSILKMDSEPAVAKGENYCSIISRTKLDVQYSSGETKTISLIIKSLPTSEVHADFIKEHDVFQREINAYTNIIKKIESLMEKHGDTQPRLWCEFLGYKPYNTIVLEDLKESGFKVVNRRDMLDLAHSKIAMRSLGRYHAMTKILVKDGEISDEFQPYVFMKDEEMVNLCFGKTMKFMAEAVKESWGAEWSDLADRIAKAVPTLPNKLLDLGKLDETRFNVYNHGDCWTTNMMFKYDKKTSTPVELRFIDFQLGHYNSFAWDLTYFMYNSIKPPVRRSKGGELLRDYHESLRNNLIRYGYPMDDIPSFESLEEEMGRMRFFAFTILCCLHPIMSAESTEAIDVDEALNNKDDMDSKAGINMTIFTCSKYKNNVKDDFLNFIELGII